MDEPTYYPIGHFHSPVPSQEDIARYFENKTGNDELLGVDLNIAEQLSHLQRIRGFYEEYPWGGEKKADLAYYYQNNAFGKHDSFEIYSFMRLYRPKKIIEIGSGFSTAAMYDTNKLFLNNETEIVCIEPYPDRLIGLLGEDAPTLYPIVLQNVNLNIFSGLRGGDILFIDSTHVTKLNSDVNRIIFDILPRLSKGVIIHFHDIVYPFTYPDLWIKQNWAWNETYILRAFLQFNSTFKIIYWSTCLSAQKIDLPISGSIWLTKNV